MLKAYKSKLISKVQPERSLTSYRTSWYQ